MKRGALRDCESQYEMQCSPSAFVHQRAVFSVIVNMFRLHDGY